MSSLTNGPHPGPNIPHKIIETTMLLEIQEKRVEKLKKELEAAQSECERLKNELEMYQNTANPGPITKCPAEVLLMIFKLFIKGDPTHVRRLLLVCSHWHRIVMEDPRMWSVIKLKVPEECWDILSWADSAHVFVTKCLHFSRSAGLDIELDFEYLKSVDFQLASRLKFGFHGLQSILQSGFDLNHITEWAAGLEYHTLTVQKDLTMACEPEHAVGLIYDLIGREGRCAERWKSLKVIFPTHYESHGIWNPIMGQSFVNLSSVSFQNLCSLYDISPNETVKPLNFPSARHLELDRASHRISLPFFSPSLHSVFLEAPLDRYCIRQLSRLTKLRILKIKPEGTKIPKIMGVATRRLSLPLLEELHVIGNFEYLASVELYLPSLRLLELHWVEGWLPINEFPAVQPQQLRLMMDRHGARADVGFMSGSMRIIMLHFTTTTELAAPFHLKGVLLDVIMELLHLQLLPAGWEFLTFHENGEIVEEIKIQELYGDK